MGNAIFRRGLHRGCDAGARQLLECTERLGVRSRVGAISNITRVRGRASGGFPGRGCSVAGMGNDA